MRRTDREITSFEEIADVLGRCDTIRIGLSGEEFPYVVPASFGFKAADGRIVIYGHSAGAGYKNRLWDQNSAVCVEADLFQGVAVTPHGITTLFESVIGFGRYQAVTDLDEKRKGLRLINGHYHYDDYPLDECGDLERVHVYKIVLERITGKRNPGGARG